MEPGQSGLNYTVQLNHREVGFLNLNSQSSVVRPNVNSWAFECMVTFLPSQKAGGNCGDSAVRRPSRVAFEFEFEKVT